MTQHRVTEGTRLIYMRADYTLETAGANNIELKQLDQGTDIQNLDKTRQ